MMRSVTRAMVGLRLTIRPLLVPGDAVALSQRNRRRRAPGSSSIRARSDALLSPGIANAVDPAPLRLHFVAPHEQGRIAFDQVEQQPLVCDAAAIFAERVGK